LAILTTPLRVQKRRMKLTRTLTVGLFLKLNYPLSLKGLDIAEEYYKNDYPDEEDSDSQDSPDDSGMTVLL
jgi:hypothetical protein